MVNGGGGGGGGKLPKRDLGLVVFFLDGDSFEARGELRGDMSRCTAVAEGGSGSMDGAGGVLVVVSAAAFNRRCVSAAAALTWSTMSGDGGGGICCESGTFFGWLAKGAAWLNGWWWFFDGECMFRQWLVAALLWGASTTDRGIFALLRGIRSAQRPAPRLSSSWALSAPSANQMLQRVGWSRQDGARAGLLQ